MGVIPGEIERNFIKSEKELLQPRDTPTASCGTFVSLGENGRMLGRAACAPWEHWTERVANVAHGKAKALPP